MAKKAKFDLGQLVQSGALKDGEKIFFVSDPNVAAAITKVSGGEYKLDVDGSAMSIHAAAQKYLGQEPPNHASQWWRSQAGKTLFQIWQDQQSAEY